MLDYEIWDDDFQLIVNKQVFFPMISTEWQTGTL